MENVIRLATYFTTEFSFLGPCGPEKNYIHKDEGGIKTKNKK